MACKVYADNSATTAVRPEVLEAMLPYLSEQYGNPSSIYGLGQTAHQAVEEAREQVAKAIGAAESEIVFTACGTESDNWAIRGVAFANQSRGKHIITSAIEHHAVLHTCKQLEKEGFSVTYLPVDETGLVSPADLKAAITDETILVTIMMANNEIGTIEPIRELSAIAHESGVLFHTDAVQAIGHIPVNVEELGVDLLSLSGHKFHAPKGIGALYIRKGTRIGTFMQGGAQERNRRAGTENVAGIVALGKAITLAVEELPETAERLTQLRDRTIKGILERVPYARLNGHAEKRLPGSLNIGFEFIEGESILLLLDMKGIAASSGSACTSGSLDPSHVLLAIGLPHEKAHGSVRLSYSRYTTEEDVDYIIETLPPIIERLRAMSPLYEEFERSQKNVQ